MEIGICTTVEIAAELPGDALDFVEENVQRFLRPEQDDAAFASSLAAAERSRKRVRAANCFLPGDLKCVGPHIDNARLLQYGETALERAERAGIERIVFGSGGARQLPAGYPKEHALMEFVSLLRLLGPIAERHRVIIAVEPLHRAECNFINSLAEGAEAVEQANHPNIRLLADTYHMAKDGESPEEIGRWGHLLAHVHVAELSGRAWPGKNREDFAPWFRQLHSVSYTGRISLECTFDDIGSEAGRSMIYLREQLAAAARPEA